MSGFSPDIGIGSCISSVFNNVVVAARAACSVTAIGPSSFEDPDCAVRSSASPRDIEPKRQPTLSSSLDWECEFSNAHIRTIARKVSKPNSSPIAPGDTTYHSRCKPTFDCSFSSLNVAYATGPPQSNWHVILIKNFPEIGHPEIPDRGHFVLYRRANRHTTPNSP
jgi:hypothetical protein